MPDASQIIRLRERRRDRPKVSLGLSLGISSFLSLTILIIIIFSTISYSTLIVDLPSPQLLISLMDRQDGLLNNPTRLMDREGKQIVATLRHPAASKAGYIQVPDELFEAGRPRLTSSEVGISPNVSQDLIAATIAIADPNFWQHAGYSIATLDPYSHPTLAQQLASDLLLWNEPAGLRRAIRERLLAAQITRLFGRAQVLEWYLNSVRYGKLVYGADAAALAYFGKTAANLGLSEAAWLAAASQTPDLAPTVEDYKQVLLGMQRSGIIGQTDADLALAQSTPPQISSGKYPSIAPGYSDYVLDRLSRNNNLDRIQRGGLTIITTLNVSLQLQAACTTYAQLERSGTKVENPDLPSGLDCQAERLLPTLPGAAGSPHGQLAANVLILDPSNGQILAYVGDPNSNLDPTSIPGHPPGSLLSPFIYLTSFTRGYTPGSLVWDISSEDVLAAIDNIDKQEHGPMRLRMALANDYLVPAAQIINRVGFENISRTLRQLGLYSISKEAGISAAASDQSILLEGAEVSLLRVVQAMGVLANQGVLSGVPTSTPESAGDSAGIVEPSVILDIRDTGQRKWRAAIESRNQPILSNQLAYLVTNILSDEAARWPTLGHPNALEIGRPAAAKLGRTAAGQDVWTVGYTPQMVIGVWIGRISPGNEPPLSTQLPAGLWHALMQNAHHDIPSKNWIMPAGISTIEVCDPSGLLPASNCPSVVSEIFLSGTEPVQTDNLYQSVQINRETGLLATIYTPAELIEEKVYLQVPPEAMRWARESGISTPPEDYDMVTSFAPADPNAQISSPGMFSVVGGVISIEGTAAGEDFSRFRIQIGRGLNPPSWIQIDEDVSTPVHAAELTRWDTRELSGLYTLQLLVEYNDRRVKTDTIQITVDNQSPVVSFLYPQPGQIIDLSSMTIQVDVADDLRLAEVRFIIDDREIARLNQPPYTVLWQTQPGEHTLEVEAVDQAGNNSRAELNFTSK